jgi:two-component system LytT family response regulator
MSQAEIKKSLSVVIVDDEVRAGDALRLMLEKFVPEVTEIAVCTDARQAAAFITQRKPQIVFLDIKMPHLSGFDVLQQIPNQQFKVIFTTAFNEFAIKAIRFSAFDYLLKPVDVEELIDTIDRFMTQQKESVQHGAMLQNMLQNMNDTAANFRLAIPFKEGIHFIQPSQILYCEGVSNYTRFYIDDGKQYLTSKTLGEYEDLLEPYGFLRSHKSYIVSKNAISYIDNDGFIILKNGDKVEISKRRKAEVMKLLKT